jgi:protein SCO1/2
MSLRNLLLFLLLSLLAACGEQTLPSPFQAGDVSAKYAQADFHLNDATTGKPVSLEDFRGKVVVLFFGYTHCPQVCPTELAELAQMMRKLGKDADRVQVLFITLDPERDTPDLLAKYPAAFYPTFKGLSGDSAATAQAAKAFGVTYEKQPNKNGGYDLDHSAGTYFIAPRGRPILLSPFWQHSDMWVQDVRLLLAFR